MFAITVFNDDDRDPTYQEVNGTRVLVFEDKDNKGNEISIDDIAEIGDYAVTTDGNTTVLKYAIDLNELVEKINGSSALFHSLKSYGIIKGNR